MVIVFCGTNHLSVSGPHVRASKPLKYNPLGYLELRLKKVSS